MRGRDGRKRGGNPGGKSAAEAVRNGVKIEGDEAAERRLTGVLNWVRGAVSKSAPAGV
jgi:hypothetical protein